MTTLSLSTTIPTKWIVYFFFFLFFRLVFTNLCFAFFFVARIFLFNFTVCYCKKLLLFLSVAKNKHICGRYSLRFCLWHALVLFVLVRCSKQQIVRFNLRLFAGVELTVVTLAVSTNSVYLQYILQRCERFNARANIFSVLAINAHELSAL